MQPWSESTAKDWDTAFMLRHGGISATTTAITPVMADENYFEADVMPSSPADAMDIDISEAAADVNALIEEQILDEQTIKMPKVELPKVDLPKVDATDAIASGLFVVDKVTEFAAEGIPKAKATLDAAVEWEKENDVVKKTRDAIDAVASFEKENEVMLKAQAAFALAFGIKQNCYG